ncbi:hypothetical protein BH10PAT3_BH10PAT3_1170 [soil metagenome]
MARTSPKHPRSQTIASIKRARTRRLAALATRSYYLHRRKQDEVMYNLICEEFMSLGGVYIKFLQGVLLRSKVMRKWHNPEKLKIFENLDSEPIDIGALLRSELPKSKLAQFALIQPQPFAAGSFGQVYYAQLRNGQPVVIKVLRPMVRELLRYDLRLLTTFSKTFFLKMFKNMSVQLNDAMKDFSKATLRETDYRHEAEFADELYRGYKGHDGIVIPKTYIDLSTDNIIVQEYVDGISVAQLVRMKEQGVDPVQYVAETIGSDLLVQLETLGYELLMGIFTLPRIQGDPHPGNIRLMKNNKVGLIDFGISAQAPTDKSAFFGLLDSYDKVFKGTHTANSLFEQGLKFFVSDLYRSLRKLGEYLGKNDNRNYLEEVSKLAEQTFIEATGSNIISADMNSNANALMQVNKLVNKGNRFGLVMKLEATEVMRAVQTYTTLMTSLGVYQDVMGNILSRAVHDIRELQPDIASDEKDNIGIGDALDTIMSWLERVADRDPMLFRQLADKIRMSKPQDLKQEGSKSA